MQTNLQTWADYMGEAPLPSFSQMIERVRAMTADDASSCRDLAELLLCDPAMTASVLRVANTIYYNPSAEPVRDIHRAVILLGFNRVAGISTTVAILDFFSHYRAGCKTMDLVWRSFHAAVQARAIATHLELSHPEQIYISALLYRLGELAFWGQAGQAAEAIARHLERTPRDPYQAQRELLGTTFDELTIELLKRWRVNSLVEAALRNKYVFDNRYRAIKYAHEIADTFRDKADNEGRRKILRKLAGLLDSDCAATERFMYTNAAQAIELARGFGLSPPQHVELGGRTENAIN